MSLHRLASFTYQVPNVAETSAYYEDFGLTDNGDGSFSTVDGGRQLYLEQGPYRRISGIELGVDDSDDLDRVAAQLRALHVEVHRDGQQQGADLVDADGGYAAWFDEIDADFVVLRPDFYIYDAGRAGSLEPVLGTLRRVLDGGVAPGGSADAGVADGGLADGGVVNGGALVAG